MKTIRLKNGRLPIGTFPSIVRQLDYDERVLVSHDGAKLIDIRRMLYRSAKELGAKVSTSITTDGLLVSLLKKAGISRMSRPVQGMRFSMQVLGPYLNLIGQPKTCEVVKVSLIDQKVILIKVGDMTELTMAHVTEEELAGFLHTIVITVNDEDKANYFDYSAELSNELEGYLWKVLD